MSKKYFTATFILGLLASASDLRAQGEVAFYNGPSTRITNALTGQPIFGTNLYLFGLYVGPPGSTEPQLTLLATVPNDPSASPNDLLAGRFFGGSVTVPGGNGSAPVEIQVRAWSLSAGNSYEAAYAVASAGDINVLLGKSDLALVYPQMPPGPPALLFRPSGPLSTFTLGPIPEPSSGALAFVGGTLLLWLGRRARHGRQRGRPPLDLSGGRHEGNEIGTNVDRSGGQWLRFRLDAGGTLSYATHGRIYDRASSNALYYHFPSLMVNCAGDMVTGFSGSSASTYIGAYFTYRPRGGSVLDPPRLIQTGLTDYSTSYWGDYSATTLDPTDDATFWTVQEFPAPSDAQYPWATTVARIPPNL